MKSKITDTNNRSRGIMDIEFSPDVVRHDGKLYVTTGRRCVNSATGFQVREMRTSEDARIWITFDGSHIWED